VGSVGVDFAERELTSMKTDSNLTSEIIAKPLATECDSESEWRSKMEKHERSVAKALHEAIENAPHDIFCMYRYPMPMGIRPACDCWKSKVLDAVKANGWTP
jgi:hypothetical protein